MNSGRKPTTNTVRIYSYGIVRLPLSFPVGMNRVSVSWKENRIRFALAKDGELGALKPHYSSTAKTPTLNLMRVFRRMNLEPEEIAGEYEPRIRNGILTIVLSEN